MGSATHPVIAARKGRPRPRERTEKSWEGRVLPHQLDSMGSVEDWRAPHGPTASRAAAGVAKGGDGTSGRKKNLCCGPGAGGLLQRNLQKFFVSDKNTYLVRIQIYIERFNNTA